MIFLRKNSLALACFGLLLAIGSYFIFVGASDHLEVYRNILLGLIGVVLLSSKMSYAINGLIFLAPLSISVGMDNLGLKISFPTEFLTLLLMVLLGMRLIYYENFSSAIVKHPISILLIIDLAWTLIVTITSEISEVSFKRFLLKLGFIGIYYFAMSHWMQHKKNRPLLFVLYGIGLLYPIYHTFKFHAMHDFSQQVSFAICEPYFSDHTIYGACLGFILPFFILKSYVSKKVNWPMFLMAVVLLTALVFSYSRASWIACLLALMFGVAVRFGMKMRLLLLMTALVSTTIIYNVDRIFFELKSQEATENDDNFAEHLGSVTNLNTDASNLERINRWAAAYNMFEERPITGFGPGTYQFEYASYQSIEFLTRISTNDGDRGHAHSEYFGALAETGLPGLVIFVVLIFSGMYYGIELLRHSNYESVLLWGALLGLFTYFIQAMFNGFLDYEKMAILVYGALAIFCIEDVERKKRLEEN